MSAIDPIMQERIYRAVKGDYLAGHFRAGERLDLQRIADRHRASKTPVREAVHRLMGERLIEPDPDSGFRIILLSPAQLIGIHAWNTHLLLGIVHGLRESAVRVALGRFAEARLGATPVELARLAGMIFLALAEATGNVEAIAAVAQVNERLLYPRILDFADVADAARELRILTNLAVSNVPKNLRRRIEAYHERKIARLRAP